MVLFKRKAVQYVQRPPVNEDQEIWAIEETDEIFTNYDDYLARMDFYRQKRFICQITGHSGLDFFTALRNETEASDIVNDAFPDQLKQPILRRVQFSTISRIDNLVDNIYDQFNQEFFPGENVTIITETGERYAGTIRDKTKFPQLENPDGTIDRAAFSRYSCQLENDSSQEAVVDNEHLYRDRKVFTKQILRSFLKNAIWREAWSGAPWLVKDSIAKAYHIPMDVPMHLRKEYQIQQRQLQSKLRKGAEANAAHTNGTKLPELKPKGGKGKNGHMSAQDVARWRQEQIIEYQKAIAADPSLATRAFPISGDAQFLHFASPRGGFQPLAAKAAPKPPSPPAPKYPIEDLEIPPVLDMPRRPDLKYLSRDQAVSDIKPRKADPTDILMKSIGPLLETWNTLNVYCEVFLLDSFTFDDYIDALHFRTETTECELLSEIHCALLKRIVNDEKDLNGKVQVTLPAAQEDEEDGSSQDSSTKPTPEPEFKPRTTRSSLAKSEAAEIKAAALLAAKVHQASEIDHCVPGYDWKMRLRKRDFKDGRWVVILVGLLNLLSIDVRYKKTCEEILAHLASTKLEPTEDAAISQYATLNINLRVQVIQILCMLCLETAAIRSYMEECTQNMTQFRKEKIDQQRARKAAIEDLKLLLVEKKALQPEETSPDPDIAKLEVEDLEESKIDRIADEDEAAAESEDIEPVRSRSLRRANDRAAERKRKATEAKEKKQKAEIEKAKKPSKQERQLEKLLKKIEDTKEAIKEYEEEIATCDNDLRENDCARTRLLGKDRFWNRYYWMERNAMPYAGLPTSSTAEADYANSCIWIQGPDEIEYEGFINLSAAENEQYRQAFGVTVPGRKMHEEGKTHLFTARDWGFYDEPKALDDLLAWLDARGLRERQLKKELQAQRANITSYMENRRKYLSDAEDKKPDLEDQPVTRVSTRTKIYVDTSAARCLKWRNTTAQREIGHIHSLPPTRKGKALPKASGATRSTSMKVAFEDEPRQTRGTWKSGKPLGRQGTRYEF
ncbi:hypothetical protein MMC25_001019 [Agyrium rufum]|nr:hypothetical protein [Agyrium rufum]